MVKTGKELADYICFDIETTGLSRDAEIIEIGAVKVRSGEITETFSELIKPERRIPTEITKITGITQSDVENCRSCADVLADFLDFTGDDILVGHNIATFDIPIIKAAAAELLGRHISPRYVDTLTMSRYVKDVPNHKQQTMLDYYGIKNERAHRAFEDCRANNELLCALIGDGFPPSVRYSHAYGEGKICESRPEKENIEFCADESCVADVVGKRVVLTGKFECMSRAQAQAALEQAGAKIMQTLSSKTDYLIVGACGSENWKYANAGGKILKAKELNVKIIAEDALRRLLLNNQPLERS